MLEVKTRTRKPEYAWQVCAWPAIEPDIPRIFFSKFVVRQFDPVSTEVNTFELHLLGLGRSLRRTRRTCRFLFLDSITTLRVETNRNRMMRSFSYRLDTDRKP